MSRFREKLYRFMSGRNGFDDFAKFLIYTALGITLANMIVSMFLPTVAAVLSFVSYFLLIYAIFRILSRNIYARSAENRKYHEITGKIKAWFKLQANRVKDGKAFVYRKCPSCKKVLRLPRKRGSHTVKCPCCGNRFSVRVIV